MVENGAGRDPSLIGDPEGVEEILFEYEVYPSTPVSLGELIEFGRSNPNSLHPTKVTQAFMKQFRPYYRHLAILASSGENLAPHTSDLTIPMQFSSVRGFRPPTKEDPGREVTLIDDDGNIDWTTLRNDEDRVILLGHARLNEIKFDLGYFDTLEQPDDTMFPIGVKSFDFMKSALEHFREA